MVNATFADIESFSFTSVESWAANNFFGVYTSRGATDNNGQSVEWTFKNYYHLNEITLGDTYVSGGGRRVNGAWYIYYFDPNKASWVLATSGTSQQPFTVKVPALPAKGMYKRWKIHWDPPYRNASTASYRSLTLVIAEGDPHGDGKAAISLRASGSMRVSTIHADKSTAKISLKASGRATTVRTATLLPRTARPVTPRHEGAWARQILNLFTERVATTIDEAPRLDVEVGELAVRLATSFNAARRWEARARLPIRLFLIGAEGNYSILPVDFDLDVDAPMVTRVGDANLRIQFGLTAASTFELQAGEAALTTSLDIWGWYPGLTLPEGEIPPPGDANLRLRLHMNFPEGLVAIPGSVEPMTVDFGEETEPRIPHVGESFPLDIGLYPGGYKVVWYSIDGHPYPHRYWDSDWRGIVDPAGHGRSLDIDIDVSPSGRVTTYGEVAPGSIDLDMTASHYPWATARAGFDLTMPPSRAMATYRGKAKIAMRLDYINFTGKRTTFGKSKPDLIWLDMTAGSLADAVLGDLRTLRLVLRSLWSGYVIRVVHPRPVTILSSAREPALISHSVRSEGI